jgi:hypothetical protein
VGPPRGFRGGAPACVRCARHAQGPLGVLVALAPLRGRVGPGCAASRPAVTTRRRARHHHHLVLLKSCLLKSSMIQVSASGLGRHAPSAVWQLGRDCCPLRPQLTASRSTRHAAASYSWSASRDRAGQPRRLKTLDPIATRIWRQLCSSALPCRAPPRPCSGSQPGTRRPQPLRFRPGAVGGVPARAGPARLACRRTRPTSPTFCRGRPPALLATHRRSSGRAPLPLSPPWPASPPPGKTPRCRTCTRASTAPCYFCLFSSVYRFKLLGS